MVAVTPLSMESLAASRSVVAATFLVARELLPQWEKWPSSTSEVIEMTGAGRTQALTMRDRLREQLPDLLGTPGRPSAVPDASNKLALTYAILDYVYDHPGAVFRVEKRLTYADSFRRHILDLRAEMAPELSLEDFSMAARLPLGTLKEWLRLPQPGVTISEAAASDEQPSVDDDDPTIRSLHLRLIIKNWKPWKGSFQAFCEMLRAEHRLPYGNTFIGDVLHGFRLRERKPRLQVEAPWSSETFRVFFPGAQWIGDGTDVVIHWNGETFIFNLEALTDGASNATVGFTVSDSEDENALRLAYEAGLVTTAAAAVPVPIGILLDNRPSNHCPAAQADMPGTIIQRSTPGRGQSKAPIEGAFGLFQQAMPTLSVTGKTPREMARAALHLVFTAWFRGRNGKPRKKLDGLSPTESYLKARPTPQEMHELRVWFEEHERRQDRARQTREARLDPVRLELLTRGLAELGIPDPERRLTLALAGYAREAIIQGLAIFRAKQTLGTLPADADAGRYLGGIIR
ncbi:MAG: hypothetical protein PSX37_05530, partial [bacterium]|nr:hypothetical protein [bacterium]